MEENYSHKPVLPREIIGFLNLSPGKVIVDATLGGGGHAEEIMKRITPGGLLIGIDRDKDSLEKAERRLSGLSCPFKLVNGNFRDIDEITRDLGIKEVDGILFDFGISSIQMDKGERGFSIKNTGPLDMRMDKDQKLTAKDLVNDLSEEELSQLIKNFGEERFHRRIAGAIVSARKRKEIESTGELAELICRSVPYGKRYNRIHPATRTFQALRIVVNDELAAIEEGIEKTRFILKKGGVVCAVSFHSLEDRIVKNTLRRFKNEGIFRVLTKKPLIAAKNELMENPRSRSAKLRAAERVL